MAIDYAKVYSGIKEAAQREGELAEDQARNVAFHMSDWLNDLEEFHRFCQSPETFTQKQVFDVLAGFLVHVPNHVAAAGKLLLEVQVADIFEVGAVDTAKTPPD